MTNRIMRQEQAIPGERRAKQERSAQTTARIAAAVLSLMVKEGLASLSHRRVAKEAGVSLASTTYHHATRADMIADASRRLLDDYLASFVRAAERQHERRPSAEGLTGLQRKLVRNAATHQRPNTLAWCEIILDAARSEQGHALARNWFTAIGEAWTDIGRAMGLDRPEQAAGPAIDVTVGLLFVTMALRLAPEETEGLFDKGLGDMAMFEPDCESSGAAAPQRGTKGRTTRDRIVAAAIDILVEHGPADVTYAAIAKRTGQAVAAAAYHFGSIGGVLRAAETQLLENAVARYRLAFAEFDPAAPGVAPLAAITTEIFLREATEWRRFTIATYTMWLEAARDESLRPKILAFIQARAEGWRRRLADSFGSASPEEGVAALAFYVGKLVRVLATGSQTADLARIAGEFATYFAAVAAEHKRYALSKKY